MQDWTSDMDAVSRHRDRSSFLRIYDHFMPRTCLYLIGRGATPEMAEELAQEALLRLWQNASSYDAGRSRLSTWLFRIARNLQIDHARRDTAWTRNVESIELAAGLGEHAPARSPAEDYAEHLALRGRIDALSAIQARLIRMAYFEAKSHQAIAEELGMPLGTVKSHLRRALMKLQSELFGEP